MVFQLADSPASKRVKHAHACTHTHTRDPDLNKSSSFEVRGCHFLSGNKHGGGEE